MMPPVHGCLQVSVDPCVAGRCLAARNPLRSRIDDAALQRALYC